MKKSTWLLLGLGVLVYLYMRKPAAPVAPSLPTTREGQLAREARGLVTDILGIFGGTPHPQNGVQGVGHMSHASACPVAKWGPQ